MAYDLEEQEQLDTLKSWWKANGNKLTYVIAIIVIAYAAFNFWQYQPHKQSTNASVLYQKLLEADGKDMKLVKALSGEIIEKYNATAYAGRAALLAAKFNYAAKDTASATAQLDWASKNAKEAGIKSIAILQLAGLKLEEKAFDDALKLLSQQHEKSFDGLYADLRGDILLAQGKRDEAKKAYIEALAALDEGGAYRRFTTQKLEALGS